MSFKAILLDIEGTTTPIDFVHKTLFPYAKERVGEFVRDNFAAIKTEIAQLKTEYEKDFTEQIYGRNFQENSPESVANYLEFLIEVDRKSTPLKSLQGKIWQAGYESGELQSVIFEDVPRAFERWKRAGKTIGIFSSGSVLAQKLIFKYSNFGDLSGLIDKYFDTNVGAKKAAESYGKIAAALRFPAETSAFVSDVTEELDAAKKSGFQTFFSIRQGNAPAEKQSEHRAIYSFDEILS